LLAESKELADQTACNTYSMQNIPELETGRLILRPINIKDAEAIFQYRSDEIANKFQGWIPRNIEDVQDFILNRVSPTINENGTWFQFVIISKAAGEIIGDAGLHFFDKENKQVEIGCTISKKHQRNGFATEAIGEVMRYLFETMNKHRIIASIDPGNISSVRLFEKLNFRKEAHFKESIRVNEVWVDDLIYAILKKEWMYNK
jgi:RimJ/RimL family protein N-acetyltransferase